MDFKLDNVVPWGRSFDEYLKMFNLTETDLKKKILDCAGGPAGFNASMNCLGNKVISCDPIYQFTAEEINKRIQETAPIIVKGLQTNLEKFVWQKIKSPQQLLEVRMAAMNQFLADFHTGKTEKRYLNHQLPNLPFANKNFDLALCSHFLFTYSDQFSFDFHIAAILELCHVANEVRLFPLLENFTGVDSPYVQEVVNQLKEKGHEVRIEKVDYEFQKKGNQMLKIYSNTI